MEHQSSSGTTDTLTLTIYHLLLAVKISNEAVGLKKENRMEYPHRGPVSTDMEETVSESVLPPQAPAPRLAPSVQEEEEEGLQV